MYWNFLRLIFDQILDTGLADRRSVVFHGNCHWSVFGQRSDGDWRHGAHRKRCGKSGSQTFSNFSFFSIVFVFVFFCFISISLQQYAVSTSSCSRFCPFYPGVAVAMGYICFLNVICYSPIQSRCLYYMFWSLLKFDHLPWEQCSSMNDSLCITNDRYLEKCGHKSVGFDLQVPAENFYQWVEYYVT